MRLFSIHITAQSQLFTPAARSTVPKMMIAVRASIGEYAERLGVSAATLYRVVKRSTGKTIYILDEPTTGLHSADVAKLLEVLQMIADAGNTVLVIEHNLDVLKSVDYIFDMGPEGGKAGGMIVASGTPEDLALNPDSVTGPFLREVL